MIEDMPTADTTMANAKPQDHFFWVIIAVGISALALAIGLFIFASSVENRDNFQVWYLLAFFLITGGMGTAIARRQFSVALLMGVLLAVVLGVSWMKFEWVKSARLLAQNASSATMLGDYVRFLPSLETHWNPYDKAPDWVKFDEECFRPALSQGSYPATCKDKNSIMVTYNIDVMQVITERFTLMKDTARRISIGELATRQAYLDCLASGGCAPVPLLPSTVIDADQLTPSMQDYKEIRMAFWDLVESNTMKPGICEFMSVCRAMTETGAVTRADFPG